MCVDLWRRLRFSFLLGQTFVLGLARIPYQAVPLTIVRRQKYLQYLRHFFLSGVIGVVLQIDKPIFPPRVYDAFRVVAQFAKAILLEIF